MHIVHTYADGSLGGVLGIFFDIDGGVSNPQASTFIDSLRFADAVPDPGFQLGNVALANFLSSVNMENFWSYNGSLTTPLCTEGIKWTLIDEIQTISQDQLDGFTSLISANNRETQPLYNRTLYYVQWTGGAVTLAASAVIMSLLIF